MKEDSAVKEKYYAEHKCVICGKTFFTYYKQQKNCSEECRRLWRMKSAEMKRNIDKEDAARKRRRKKKTNQELIMDFSNEALKDHKTYGQKESEKTILKNGWNMHLAYEEWKDKIANGIKQHDTM